MDAGAAEARGDVLLFLHADTLLPADAAALACETLARDGVVAGAFAFAVPDDARHARLISAIGRARHRLGGVALRRPGRLLLGADVARPRRIWGRTRHGGSRDGDASAPARRRSSCARSARSPRPASGTSTAWCGRPSSTCSESSPTVSASIPSASRAGAAASRRATAAAVEERRMPTPRQPPPTSSPSSSSPSCARRPTPTTSRAWRATASRPTTRSASRCR